MHVRRLGTWGVEAMMSTCTCGLLCLLINAAEPSEGVLPGGAVLKLLPYPQQLDLQPGHCRLGPPDCITDDAPTETEQTALETMRQHFPKTSPSIPVHIGSCEEGFQRSWLTDEQAAFLADESLSAEASCVIIAPERITVVGKGKWGMLYGVQTLNQLAIEAARKERDSIPCMTIRDWPDMAWRCLSPQLTWYSGWNRLEGYDCGNWREDEWKWLVDWSLLHKTNAWAVCMYGHWPFTLPGYEQETLDLESFRYNPETGVKESYRFTHPNIENEFFPEVIRYANARGIQVYAYPGKNSFNGADFKNDPERYAGGAAEMLPFAPGVDAYWNAFLGRILELGFNGFVFEDPEANHVPNQNAECYDTFWKPWEEKYGFSSVEETDRNNPPLGVHVEYYTWLFRQFDEKIQAHGKRLGRDLPVPIFLISHILVARMMNEAKDQKEREEWFALIDRKHGREAPFIFHESREQDYVSLLGSERVASLGGRGGSCTNAMRRIASVNNNWLHGGMGGDIVHDIMAQQRIHEAGGMGAMGYIFEWTNTEVFGYIAAQYLWRNAGIPGIDSRSQVDFLDYAYRIYYGDEVGALVARVMDEGACVNDAMVLPGVHGSQWPHTGDVLHRDYQYLAVLAERTERLAREAYWRWTGEEPELSRPVYQQEDFRWNGYSREADRRFKAERLRQLWVSTVRSAEMCKAALAHRKAERLIAEGAPAEAVLGQLDAAIVHARRNEHIYQMNYEDDYDWTDGLCSFVTAKLEEQRARFMEQVPGETPMARYIPWEAQTDILPEQQDAAKPGLYLSTNLGLTTREDYFRLGVVFSVEASTGDGTPEVMFRRSLGRRHTGWEHWDIPLSGTEGRLRLVTDAYSRAQNRLEPTWEWPLWGNPQLIRLTPDGERVVLRDLDASDAEALVRLDRDGLERPFDGPGVDTTGAMFQTLRPGPVARKLAALREEEGRDWQWLDGFAEWSAAPPHQGAYRNYLGTVDSGWAYGREGGAVAWRTVAADSVRPTAIAFVGGTDYVPGEAMVHVNNRHVLNFDTGRRENTVWESDHATLRYIHGADTRDEKTAFGLSGLFVLLLPASMVTVGEPVEITVEMKPGTGGWFMVHGYEDAIREAAESLIPKPEMRAIAAFTPHGEGAFGLTIAEYGLDLRVAERNKEASE